MADAAQRSVGCWAVRFGRQEKAISEFDVERQRWASLKSEINEVSFDFFPSSRAPAAPCSRCMRLMPHVLGSPHCRRHIDTRTGAHPLPMSAPGLGSPLPTSAPGLGSPDTRTCTPARIMAVLPGRAGLTPLEPSCRCSRSATRWTTRAERSQRRVATGCNMPLGSATGPVASSDI
jgi:hypothetical protein